MGKAVDHRGPDDEDASLGRGTALRMRRLSIVDPSGRHRPISNEDVAIFHFATDRCSRIGDMRWGKNHGRVFTPKQRASLSRQTAFCELPLPEASVRVAQDCAPS